MLVSSYYFLNGKVQLDQYSVHNYLIRSLADSHLSREFLVWLLTQFENLMGVGSFSSFFNSLNLKFELDKFDVLIQICDTMQLVMIYRYNSSYI